ncbi:MAG TPA: TIM barrel protein [Vicinamibacterales bacterium]|nr:TIM barrel protein [Vicinamibacterales bacterium]
METEKLAHIHSAAGTPLTRRSFLAASALGLVALQRRHPVTIGVQSYSFRDRSLADAIAGMQKVGLHSCELWQSHVEPRGISREEMRKWRETIGLDHFHRVHDQFAKAKISLSAYNISFRDDFSDAEIERGFEMAAALGAPAITASSNVKTTARIAPVATRRKMKVGVHNHSRIDPNEFATTKSLTDALQAGPFIAVNLDIGHFTAANEDAVAFLQQHHTRIVTLHIKDRRRNQGDNVPFGEGDTPITKVLNLLQQNGWPIPANIEYEYKGGDTVDEVAKCVAYCRKALNL